MKNILIVVIFLNLSICAFAQIGNPLSFDDYSTHVFFHYGIIRHEVKTESENHVIEGGTVWDRSVSLSVFHFFKNYRTAISLQGSYGDYSSQFFTTSEKDFDAFYSNTSNSSYYKLEGNYNYMLKRSNKMDLLFYAGPSVFVQTRTGKYYDFETLGNPMNTPPAFVSTGSFHKIRKITLGSQFGANLFYKAFKRSVFSLNIGYSLGFQDFYEGRISTRQYSNGANLDNAIIRGRGNGFYGFLGFSVPIRKFK